MFKKLLSILLCLTLACSVLVACAAGEQGERGLQGEQGIRGEPGPQGDSGKDGVGIVKAELVNGRLMITYSDGRVEALGPLVPEVEGTDSLDFYPLPDGSYAVSVGKAYFLEEIVIPSTYRDADVTLVLDGAFSDAPNLSKITLPDTLTSIGVSAFQNCTALREVVLGEDSKLSVIGENAFANCGALLEFAVPDRVTEIRAQAFLNCVSLERVTFGENSQLASVGARAFLGCDELEEPDYPDGVDFEIDWSSVSFGNKPFTVLSRESTSYEFEAISGGTEDAISSAVYERNLIAEECLGVELEIIKQSGEWADREAFLTDLRHNALAPVSEYDLVGSHSTYLICAATEGLLYDLGDLPYMDLNEEWWSQGYYDQVNYRGSIYLMHGDLAYSLYEKMMVVFFNQNLAEQAGIPDLYELALAGNWTFEEWKTYTSAITTDLDAGDAAQYGFLTSTHAHRQIPIAFNCDIAAYDPSADKREITVILAEGTAEIIQQYADFVLTNPSVQNASDYTDQTAIFEEGRALFFAGELGLGASMKANMTNDYGILPFPKYRADQSEYRTGARDSLTGVVVPYNVADPQMVGAVTEFLSMTSQETVVPAFYGSILKSKDLHDLKCIQTLLMIRNSFTSSFEMAYTNPLGYVGSFVDLYITEGANKKVGQVYSTRSMVWQQSLRELYQDLNAVAARDR